jgi:Ca2+-binding EF-hand superfamily protein
MPTRTNMVRVLGLFTGLVAAGVTPGSIVAQTTANVPKPQDRLAIGENEVKQLLLLMDTDKNGQISKLEYMTFMEAEFERLDKNKNGELDVKELTQSKLRSSHFTAVGK